MDPANQFAMEGINMAFAGWTCSRQKRPTKGTLFRYHDLEDLNAN